MVRNKSEKMTKNIPYRSRRPATIVASILYSLNLQRVFLAAREPYLTVRKSYLPTETFDLVSKVVLLPVVLEISRSSSLTFNASPLRHTRPSVACPIERMKRHTSPFSRNTQLMAADAE